MVSKKMLKFLCLIVALLGLFLLGKHLFSPTVSREALIREYGSYAGYIIFERNKAIKVGNDKNAFTLFEELKNLKNKDFLD